MPYSLMADLVVVVHFGFLAFIAVGALLAWRWPWLIWLHIPAVGWGVAIITIGFDCPLTPLEKYFRRRAGEAGYRGGFVDRYIENVVYPDELTPLLRALAAVAIVGGYAGVVKRRRSRSASRPRATAAAGRGHAG